MKKKVLALLLAAGMVLSMVGCGEKTTTDDAAKDTTAATTEVADDATEDAEATSILPWTGEEVTLEFFWFDTGNDYSKTDSPIVAKLLEMMGNVTIECQLLPLDDYDTKMPIMCADGEIPDFFIVRNPMSYISQYGSDIFLDYNEYSEYMPNILAWAEKIERFDSVVNAEGQRFAIPCGFGDDENIQEIWLYNTGALEAIGMEVPQTAEEFYNCCKAYVEKGLPGYPLQSIWGMGMVNGGISQMFKRMGDKSLVYYDNWEKSWSCGPLREDSNYKDYLTFLNSLYEIGAYNPEVDSQTDEASRDNIYRGDFLFTYFYQETYGTNPYEPGVAWKDYAADWQILPFTTPEGTDRTVYVTSPMDGPVSWSCMTGVDCEYPELVTALLDLMHTDECITLKGFGVEGVSFEYDENGNPQFTDNMATAYNYYAGENTLSDYGYWCHPLLRSMNAASFEASKQNNYSPEIYEAYTAVETDLDNGVAKAVYGVTKPAFTAEENDEIATITAPMSTYLSECQVKFITGEMDIETEWDTFIETLASYGDIDRVLEIYNSYEMPEYNRRWK